MVGLRGAARHGVDPRDDALARLQLALLGLYEDRLVVAGPDHVAHVRQAVAVLAGDRAAVRDLAAALRVERGLRELHEDLAVALDQPGDDGVLLERLVSRELGGLRREIAHDSLGRADLASARSRGGPPLHHPADVDPKKPTITACPTRSSSVAVSAGSPPDRASPPTASG